MTGSSPPESYRSAELELSVRAGASVLELTDASVVRDAEEALLTLPRRTLNPLLTQLRFGVREGAQRSTFAEAFAEVVIAPLTHRAARENDVLTALAVDFIFAAMCRASAGLT